MDGIFRNTTGEKLQKKMNKINFLKGIVIVIATHIETDIGGIIKQFN